MAQENSESFEVLQADKDIEDGVVRELNFWESDSPDFGASLEDNFSKYLGFPEGRDIKLNPKPPESFKKDFEQAKLAKAEVKETTQTEEEGVGQNGIVDELRDFASQMGISPQGNTEEFRDLVVDYIQKKAVGVFDVSANNATSLLNSTEASSEYQSMLDESFAAFEFNDEKSKDMLQFASTPNKLKELDEQYFRQSEEFRVMQQEYRGQGGNSTSEKATGFYKKKAKDRQEESNIFFGLDDSSATLLTEEEGVQDNSSKVSGSMLAITVFIGLVAATMATSGKHSGDVVDLDKVMTVTEQIASLEERGIDAHSIVEAMKSFDASNNDWTLGPEIVDNDEPGQFPPLSELEGQVRESAADALKRAEDEPQPKKKQKATNTNTSLEKS